MGRRGVESGFGGEAHPGVRTMTATSSLRLLRAEYIDDNGTTLDIEFGPMLGSDSHTTLMTGRNGSGKSRILSAIALAFDALDGSKPRSSVDVSVEYMLNGHECAIHVQRKALTGYLDGKIVRIEELPRPRAVVAVTASAFDKFELPTSQNLFTQSPKRGGLYRYLGLKDARGRVSTKAGILRALAQLFEATALDDRRRVRVAGVFDYLGYLPQVEVHYRWTRRGRNFLEAGSEQGLVGYRRFLESEHANTPTGQRPILGDYFFEDRSAIDQLARAATTFRSLGDEKYVAVTAEFAARQWSRDEKFRHAQQLSRARLLEMAEVKLRRKSNGALVNIEDASSGELAVATATLGIASSIDDQSLILMDEPEISLHPAWQADYLRRLAETFGAFEGCHFILATHSATLVAGASPESSNVVDLETAERVARYTHIGNSADEVLVRTFGVAQEGNLYLHQLLIEALRLIADRATSGGRFAILLRELESVANTLPTESSIRQVIADLGHARLSPASDTS